MKKQNSYFVEEREIEGRKVFAAILKKWRLLLLLAIIGALLAVAADYSQRKKAAAEEAQAAEEAANAEPVTIESLEKSMDRYERQQVWRFVYMTNTLEERKNYLSKSIRMTINPYKERAIDIEYQILSADSSEAAAEEYVTYVTGAQFSKDLVKQMGVDIYTCYLEELITAEASGSTLRIHLIADSREVCNYLADAVEAVLVAYEPGSADVTLQKESRIGMYVIDKELAEEQQSYNDDLELYTSSYNSLKKALSDDQKKLANLMLKAGIVSENTETLKDAAAEAEAEESTESTETAAAAETASSEETETTHVEIQPEAVSVHWSKALYGLLAGLLAAVVWVILRYTLSQAVHGMEEAKYLFGVRDMGTVSMLTLQKKRWGSRVDLALEKMGSHNYMEYEKQLALVCANLLLACQKENLKQVAAVGSRPDLYTQAIVAKIKKYLAKEGIELKLAGNVLCDDGALLAAAQVKTVLLVEEDERSYCSDIAKELNLLEENGIRLIGMAALSNCR